MDRVSAQNTIGEEEVVRFICIKEEDSTRSDDASTITLLE